MADESIPRFNHVAMSVPADLLGEAGREAILRFYGEVFGWTEMPTTTEDGVRLVLRVHSNEQFVFLHADDDPMRCPTTDHFGMSVPTPEALDAIHGRALKFREGDPRVEISERRTEDFKAVQLHNVYIRYLLPLTIELQCFEWAPGFDAQRLA